ncbi:MAG: glycoside hydrolase family 97 catalytic domain-containing protein [Calditrichaceae bacterium]|nr:glycoside hydrolase family 97 catalytic domain-containing protein [Calditrichaceae bacterium]
MNRIITTILIFVFSSIALAQKITVDSPTKKLQIALYNQQNRDSGEWYLKLYYKGNGSYCEVIPEIKLGLSRSDQTFSKDLKFIHATNTVLIEEKYSAIHGKRKECKNSANEVVVTFENPEKVKLNIIIRVYNDGAAFRYEFPEKRGSYVMKDELTSYKIPEGTKRWMEKWDLANEGLYTFIEDENVQQTWCYPALFQCPDSSCWYLIHEADVNRNYCASKLSNITDKSCFKITFPDSGDGDGESQPTIKLPWKSPWRVIIIGSLADIVESTLVSDVCPPSVITQTDWIKPGKASWNYWSHNHGTKDYQIVCDFADLAAAMDWPYTLLDWEWDQMGNGGNLEDALKYIQSKGVKPLMWYNSGAFKWVRATPRDRMLKHESRIKEFSRLKKLGVVGVKIDFFLSDKQDMINYYLDILEDAAQHEMMVYFHGCLVPRGWSRTYPHLMTYEGVRGAEWYNNGPEFTTSAPSHNTIIPFTRNVVGSMDYTPVTFTNSQFPHITSYGHELAQSVVFESGIQHMADRPCGYYGLPDAAKTFLKEVPNAWDYTKLLDGYPGKEVIIARRKNDAWYIGGLNSEKTEKMKTIIFDFLPNGVKYKLILIADGKHDKEFSIYYHVADKSSSIDVKMLRRGGFAAYLEPIE